MPSEVMELHKCEHDECRCGDTTCHNPDCGEPDYEQIMDDRGMDRKPWYADHPYWEGER